MPWHVLFRGKTDNSIAIKNTPSGFSKIVEKPIIIVSYIFRFIFFNSRNGQNSALQKNTGKIYKQ